MSKFLDSAGLIALWDKILYKLSFKQNKLKATVGYMYRSNVSGSGSLSIQGNSGQFPRLNEAGTYIVKTRMSSATSSYTLSVNYGGISYSLTSENGVIEDERELTLPAGATWAGSVTPVASNTICEVAVISTGSVTELAPVATSGSYNDLANKPSIPAAQIQSDWNQTTTTAKDYIKNKPTIPTVPTNVSAFTNDAGYLTSYTETDPTVPAWAKASTKPTYTASEVGALPDTTVIPDDSNLVHKTGDEILNNSKTFLGTVTIDDIGGKGKIVLTGDDHNGWDQIESQATNTNLKQELDARNNVQANWNETDISSDAYIQNKPTIPAAQVNSDWSASSGVAQILNKPTLYYVQTTAINNITAVGSASTWSFAMGTGNDEHTLIISGGNSTTPTLGNAIYAFTGLSENSSGGHQYQVYSNGNSPSGGGSN